MNLKTTKNNKGFSLIELMIAMVIFVVIVGLIVDNYVGQESQNVTQNQVVEIQQNARAGLYMIVREIRMAGYDPWGTSGAMITAAGTGSNGSPLIFTYVGDNNNDGIVDINELKTITINLFDSSIDSGTVATIGAVLANDEIQITAAGKPIAENIAALQFTYFDKDGVLLSPPINNSQIRSIQVSLTARADETERNLSGITSGGIALDNRTLVARVKCRNLGL